METNCRALRRTLFPFVEQTGVVRRIQFSPDDEMHFRPVSVPRSHARPENTVARAKERPGNRRTVRSFLPNVFTVLLLFARWERGLERVHVSTLLRLRSRQMEPDVGRKLKSRGRGAR